MSVQKHDLRLCALTLCLAALLFVPLTPAPAQDTDVATMLADMDHVLRGDSHRMTVSLFVKTSRWERDYKIQVAMQGVDFAFARVLEPAKVEGQGFLRIESRLWQYLPSAERTILIPPSMMLDNFMGSDFSNDDFVKLSYMPRDYEGTLTGSEEIDGIPCFHLELLPHEDAPVTYGKLEVWLRQSDHAPVRWVFYNEDLEKIRTLYYREFKTFGEHALPTVWHMVNHVKEDRETIVTILDAEFDIPINASVFTRSNLEKYP